VLLDGLSSRAWRTIMLKGEDWRVPERTNQHSAVYEAFRECFERLDREEFGSPA
jgi:hypothetical protein